MKNYIYLIAILLFALTAFACGGGEKTQTKENESKQISTAPNAAVSPRAVNATNENPVTRRDDLDADDVTFANSNQPVNGKVKNSEKKDADDLRSGNTNQKRLDRDDQNQKRDADYKRSSANTRRDSDDSGNRDNDRDSDDN